MNNYIILDLETTGFSPLYDQIVEIGALRVEGNKVVAKFQTFIKGVVVGSSVKIHGITQQMVDEGGIDLLEAISLFKEFSQDYPIVAHNGNNFDFKFIKVVDDSLNNLLVDSRVELKKIVNTSSYSLEKLVQVFKINNKVKHRALDDCYSLFEVLNKVKSQISSISFLNFKDIKIPCLNNEDREDILSMLIGFIKENAMIKINFTNAKGLTTDRWITPKEVVYLRGQAIKLIAFCSKDGMDKTFNLKGLNYIL